MYFVNVLSGWLAVQATFFRTRFLQVRYGCQYVVEVTSSYDVRFEDQDDNDKNETTTKALFYSTQSWYALTTSDYEYIGNGKVYAYGIALVLLILASISWLVRV